MLSPFLAKTFNSENTVTRSPARHEEAFVVTRLLAAAGQIQGAVVPVGKVSLIGEVEGVFGNGTASVASSATVHAVQRGGVGHGDPFARRAGDRERVTEHQVGEGFRTHRCFANELAGSRGVKRTHLGVGEMLASVSRSMP